MALQPTTSCKILPSRFKALSGVSNHRFAFMMHDVWWFLDDFRAPFLVLGPQATRMDWPPSKCWKRCMRVAFKRPRPTLGRSHGAGGVRHPSVSDAFLQALQASFFLWFEGNTFKLLAFQVWQTKLLGEVKSHRTTPKKWAPKQKFAPTIPNPYNLGSTHLEETSLHLSKNLLIHTYPTSWDLMARFFFRPLRCLVFGRKLLSQVDPGSPEFGCSDQNTGSLAKFAVPSLWQGFINIISRYIKDIQSYRGNFSSMVFC